MNQLKHKNMMASYTGHRGAATMGAILDQVPETLLTTLTGKELGLVMDAINAAYHAGRASHGGLDLCDDCYWFPGVDEEGALVPTEAINSIAITKDADGTSYSMAYKEPKPY